MGDIGPNDKCPCGSKLKYKRCFLAELPSCANFAFETKKQLMNEHAQKDKFVFKFFDDAINDIRSVFRIDPATGNDYVAPRVQLVVIFSLIDVVASYWDEYHQSQLGQKERFLRWCAQYCFTPRNDQYKDGLRFFNSEKLYDLRCSVVHFFGLGKAIPEYLFGIAPNRIDQVGIEEKIKSYKKLGRKIVMLQPKALHQFVLEGAILMLNEWKDVIAESHLNENKKLSHISGIDRIYLKIKAEGAIKDPVGNNTPTCTAKPPPAD